MANTFPLSFLTGVFLGLQTRERHYRPPANELMVSVSPTLIMPFESSEKAQIKSCCAQKLDACNVAAAVLNAAIVLR